MLKLGDGYKKPISLNKVAELLNVNVDILRIYEKELDLNIRQCINYGTYVYGWSSIEIFESIINMRDNDFCMEEIKFVLSKTGGARLESYTELLLKHHKLKEYQLEHERTSIEYQIKEIHEIIEQLQGEVTQIRMKLNQNAVINEKTSSINCLLDKAKNVIGKMKILLDKMIQRLKVRKQV